MKNADLKTVINKVAEDFPGVIWGACDVSNTNFSNQYKNAIIMVIPFSEMLSLDGYQEPYFRKIQYQTFPIRNALEDKLSKALAELGIDHHVVTLPNLEKTLQAEFSTKEGARRSGLGWIGKNDLLVTEKYGPRLSLSAILIQADIEIGTAMKESRCGNCRKCIQACTFQTLYGINWTKETKNEDIVDYQRCHEQRNRAKKTALGRKLACGKCIVSCPYGIINT